MGKLRLGVLASGGGTNLQAIIDNCEAGRIDAEVRVVISNNSKSGALERARKHGIAAVHLSSVKFDSFEALDEAILSTLKRYNVDLVLLAGYMKKVGPKVLEGYKNRVLNIHPALLPKFGAVVCMDMRCTRRSLPAVRGSPDRPCMWSMRSTIMGR